ncbi:MAG: protein phosphatase CheZ [Magnetospirillum sp. WYHS-4]
MAIDHSKRPFRAELRRQQEAGAGAAVPGGPPLDDAAARARHDELMSAIHQLRADLTSRDAVAPTVLEEYKKEVFETASLKHQLQEVSEAILTTKKEIAKLHPLDRSNDRIAAMTDELDAVVDATEGATEVILAASEKIEALTESIRVHASSDDERNAVEDITDQILKIFEACNFQDLTGQRITRVVNTLRFVEERIDTMISALGGEKEIAQVVPEAQAKEGDARLLHGPQSGENRISQSEIDSLFD